MKLNWLAHHRPSAPLLISLTALFVALGGVGWAATQLPAGSVGTAQLQSRAVTGPKLAPGAVGQTNLANGAVSARKVANGGISAGKIKKNAIGRGQIDVLQVQQRAYGTCSGAKGAIGRIRTDGRVSCNPTLPAEFGATHGSIGLTGAAKTIVSKALPGGASYLILASTDGGNGTSCTLSAAGASAGGTTSLQLAVRASGGTTAALSCHGGGTLTGASLNAIQTEGNQ